jgi:hypothetical protein
MAIVVRLMFLKQPMHYDEAFTFTNYASKPLNIALSDYSAPNNHVFHTILVHITYRLLGNQPWITRIPAFFAGVLLVPAVYLAARSLYNKHAALLAAAFVATSVPLIAYSTNARGYGLICLTFLITLALAKYLKRGASRVLWIPFTLFAVLGFYTIPIMLYPLGGIVIWLCLSIAVGNTIPPRLQLLRDIIATSVCIGILTVLCYLPILIRSGPKPLIANRFVAPQSWVDVITNLPGLIPGLWHEWGAGLPFWVVSLLGVGFVVAILYHWRLSDDRIPIGFAMLVWSATLVLVTRNIPFARVWLFLLPLVLIMASGGLAFLVQVAAKRVMSEANAVAVLALVLATAMSVHVVYTQVVVDPHFGDTATLRDAPEIATSVKQWLQEGDKILTAIPADAPLEYYLDANQVPRSYLAWPSKRPTAKPVLAGSVHLFIVVDEDRGQTLKSVFKENKIDPADYSSARPLQRYAYGSVVYEVNRDIKSLPK